MTHRTILFNHIPKTGGITLRIILDKIYGSERIFTLKSTDLGSSLAEFNHFSEKEMQSFDVIAGHGAEMLSHYFDDPFRISILREPISLFLSQYYFLKISKGTDFYEDVRLMESLEEYEEYAIEKGQDNLLTRYLSNSIQFLADKSLPVPSLELRGRELLEKAKQQLFEYDSLIELSDFDAGVFYLAHLLDWKNIPIYRPSNRNNRNPGKKGISRAQEEHLREILKYDIELYEFFKEMQLSTGLCTDRSSFSFKTFRVRQQAILSLVRVLRK